MSRFSKIEKIAVLTIALVVSVNIAHVISAQTIDELQRNISDRDSKIKQLDEEIKSYEKQLQAIGDDKKTLQGAIQELDLSQKKLGSQIKKTQASIQSTNLTIQGLNGDMDETQTKVNANTAAIAKTLNYLYQHDDDSLIENLLNDKSLSDILDEYQTVSQFQERVKEQSEQLRNYKQQLSDKKTSTEKEKAKLVSLQSELNDQNDILSSNKKAKNSLLSETQNKESAYQTQLAEIKARRDQLEKELQDYESQLQYKLNPSSLPKTGSRPLSWPLDAIRVTQVFGDTEFSRANPGAYNGKGHNGVDFGASIGTPIKAAASGRVLGTGDTDTVCPRASYGKWVLIEHGNGLTSLYAHLSLIKTAAGQNVSTGQVIGYSGNTGYSTGPHLHFGLYASEGVEITSLKSKACRGTYTLPVASWSAYLNPMIYLPAQAGLPAQ